LKPVLVDTDILSLFLRGQQAVTEHFHTYLAEHHQINFSIITYYEIVSGLRHKDAHRQLEGFKEFQRHNRLLPLTIGACDIAAELYARLRKLGTPVGRYRSAYCRDSDGQQHGYRDTQRSTFLKNRWTRDRKLVSRLTSVPGSSHPAVSRETLVRSRR